MLKIARHCSEVLVGSISGILLGSINRTVLEIADCYRTIPNNQNHREYALNMQECLGQLGIENYMVGWYGRAYYNEFLYTKRVAMDCFLNQENIYFSVCLIYDPLCSRNEKLALKAFRLRPEMLEQFRYDPICSMESLLRHKISTHDIFEEICIEIHNHSLINTFLFEIKNFSSEFSKLDCSSLAMNSEDDIVDLISRLGSAINRFKNEQINLKIFNRDLYSWYTQRDSYRKQHINCQKKNQVDVEFEAFNKRPMDKGYLDCILTTTQMYELSNQVLETMSNDFYKIWITKGL